MSTNTLSILDTTVYGIASGNYDGSSEDFYSDAARAVGYYLGQGSLQTAIIQVLGFTGDITLQGTLNTDPTAAVWNDLYLYGSDSSTTVTDYNPETIMGNFTWMRARITNFSDGTIVGITITY